MIAVHFKPKSMSKAQYDEVIRLMEAAGGPWPTSHVCFGEGNSLEVVDTFEDRAAFDEFGKALMGFVGKVGIELDPPRILPVQGQR